MSRYKENTTSVPGTGASILAGILTGGLSTIADAVSGPKFRTEVRDRETGRTGVGFGGSKRESRDNAHRDLHRR